MSDRLDAPTFSFLSVDITPVRAVSLAGYVHRRGAFERIETNLEANILIVNSSGRAPVIFAVLDTLFIDDVFRDTLADALQIDSTRFILIASHTHNAPSLFQGMPCLGEIQFEYFDSVIRRMADAIRGHLRDGFPALKIADTSVKGHYSVNRRRSCWVADYSALKEGRLPSIEKKIAMAQNPTGFAENIIKVWVLASTEKTEAILWSVPAHPAFFPLLNAVSSDFPGAVRDRLRRHFGRHFPIFYCPGFSGSAIPVIPFSFPRSTKELLFNCLPFFPLLPHFTIESFRAYCDRLAYDIQHALLLTDSFSTCDSITLTQIRSDPIFNDKNESDVSLNVSALKFSETLTLMASSGELVGEWSPILNLPYRMIATGYAAGRPLYVPTAEQLIEGGYEVNDFQQPFGLSGSFSKGIDETLDITFQRLFIELAAPDYSR